VPNLVVGVTPALDKLVFPERSMKDILKVTGNRTLTVGAALIVASLVLRNFDTGIPSCLVAVSLAAGLVSVIFAAGRMSD
jgi:hypothetical protein